MNNFFCSVFTKGASNIPTIENRADINEIENIVFDINDVAKKLIELDVTKSSGPDNIPAAILKHFAPTFAPILKSIFEKSYDTGTVPSQMKSAIVVPLHK